MGEKGGCLNDQIANMESRYVVKGDWKLLLDDSENYGLPYASKGQSGAGGGDDQGPPCLVEVPAYLAY